MASTVKWTLITVSHNSAKALSEFWNSGIPDDVEWLVVDNASADDSVGVAKSLGASRAIELETNIGFGAANNIALEIARGEYVAFVNPDVRVDFENLVGMAERIDHHGGVITPQLVFADGRLQPNLLS